MEEALHAASAAASEALRVGSQQLSRLSGELAPAAARLEPHMAAASAALRRAAAPAAAALRPWVPQGTELELTLGCFALFVVLQSAAVVVLKRSKTYARLSVAQPHEAYSFLVLPASQVHALLSLTFAFLCIFGPDGEVLGADRVLASTPLSRAAHAFSCAYFFFDLLVVVHHEPLDLKFLLHAVVCGLAYWFAQAPVFQYYTVRFLLYELSTPLLNVKLWLQFVQGPKLLTGLADLGFKLAFVGCRLVYGVPLAVGFDLFLLQLVERARAGGAQAAKLPSLNVLYFSIFAVTSMAGLNVLWFLLGFCSGGAKPAVKAGQAGQAGKKAKSHS
jgi:hypothetical protein